MGMKPNPRVPPSWGGVGGALSWCQSGVWECEVLAQKLFYRFQDSGPTVVGLL